MIGHDKSQNDDYKVESFFYLGLIKKEQGDREKAKEYFESAIILGKGHKEAEEEQEKLSQ